MLIGDLRALLVGAPAQLPIALRQAGNGRVWPRQVVESSTVDAGGHYMAVIVVGDDSEDGLTVSELVGELDGLDPEAEIVAEGGDWTGLVAYTPATVIGETVEIESED